MILPADVRAWPSRWADDLAERVAIMAESDVPDAERKAEADIRRVASGTTQEDLFA